MTPKKGTSFPKTGTPLPNASGNGEAGVNYPGLIAAALRSDFDQMRGATKLVMQWTGASERTVKSWFTGRKGPNSDHLIVLARHSDSVFEELLRLCGREQRSEDAQLAQARHFLKSAMFLLDNRVAADP